MGIVLVFILSRLINLELGLNKILSIFGNSRVRIKNSDNRRTGYLIRRPGRFVRRELGKIGGLSKEGGLYYKILYKFLKEFINRFKVFRITKLGIDCRRKGSSSSLN